MEISQNFVAFSEYMNFNFMYYIWVPKFKSKSVNMSVRFVLFSESGLYSDLVQEIVLRKQSTINLKLKPIKTSLKCTAHIGHWRNFAQFRWLLKVNQNIAKYLTERCISASCHVPKAAWLMHIEACCQHLFKKHCLRIRGD